MADKGPIQRLPIAAMDEKRGGRGLGIGRQEQVELLPVSRAIGQVQLRAHPTGAEGGGISCPACDDFGAFGHAGPIIIFPFGIHAPICA